MSYERIIQLLKVHSDVAVLTLSTLAGLSTLNGDQPTTIQAAQTRYLLPRIPTNRLNPAKILPISSLSRNVKGLWSQGYSGREWLLQLLILEL